MVIDSTAKGFDSGGLNMPGSQVPRCESQLCQGLKGKVGTGASLKCTGKVRQKMGGTWIFFFFYLPEPFGNPGISDNFRFSDISAFLQQ